MTSEEQAVIDIIREVTDTLIVLDADMGRASHRINLNNARLDRLHDKLTDVLNVVCFILGVLGIELLTMAYFLLR